MEIDEAEAIRLYKEYAKKHLPYSDTLSGYWAPDFDASLYSDDVLHGLELYLNQLRKFTKVIVRAAFLRQRHYEDFILAKNKDEDEGHEAWRKGMNLVARDAEDKLLYWSSIRDDLLDKAVKEFESLPKPRLTSIKYIANVKNTSKPEKVTDTSHIVRRPTLSAAEKRRRKNERKKQAAKLVDDAFKKAELDKERVTDIILKGQAKKPIEIIDIAKMFIEANTILNDDKLLELWDTPLSIFRPKDDVKFLPIVKLLLRSMWAPYLFLAKRKDVKDEEKDRFLKNRLTSIIMVIIYLTGIWSFTLELVGADLIKTIGEMGQKKEYIAEKHIRIGNFNIPANFVKMMTVYTGFFETIEDLEFTLYVIFDEGGADRSVIDKWREILLTQYLPGRYTLLTSELTRIEEYLKQTKESDRLRTFQLREGDRQEILMIPELKTVKYKGIKINRGREEREKYMQVRKRVLNLLPGFTIDQPIEKCIQCGSLTMLMEEISQTPICSTRCALLKTQFSI